MIKEMCESDKEWLEEVQELKNEIENTDKNSNEKEEILLDFLFE